MAQRVSESLHIDIKARQLLGISLEKFQKGFVVVVVASVVIDSI